MFEEAGIANPTNEQIWNWIQLNPVNSNHGIPSQEMTFFRGMYLEENGANPSSAQLNSFIHEHSSAYNNALGNSATSSGWFSDNMFIIGLAILAILSFLWMRKKRTEIADEEGDFKHAGGDNDGTDESLWNRMFGNGRGNNGGGNNRDALL